MMTVLFHVLYIAVTISFTFSLGLGMMKASDAIEREYYIHVAAKKEAEREYIMAELAAAKAEEDAKEKLHLQKSAKESGMYELKESVRPDSLIQNAIYSHGLDTGFDGKRNVKDIIDKMVTVCDFSDDVFNNAEICASWKTQKIGGCGLYIKGDVTVASNIDLYSFVDANGERIFNKTGRVDGIFTRREELDLHKWDHTEFFVRPESIVGFWIKQSCFSAADNEMLVFIARSMGLRVFIK